MEVSAIFLISCGLVTLIMLLVLSRPHQLRWDKKLGLWLSNVWQWWQDLQEDIECAPLEQKLNELVKRRWDVAERLLKAQKLRSPNQKRKWYLEKVIYDLKRGR
ncbi:hypothetical protein APA_553 [Pseudanabaena sp. lw0831]|uniref:hypothetical protein n=1 Tax=Pseudanabaena sp. lw0831 TaxID=1357935 RepID=UPI0019160B2B|nr:hypothetical protein [Pseudanabaena sp. lw0831]GBO51589.1 hypothetical protein APA_553 [Pseudanabaena sp. lw0831]